MRKKALISASLAAGLLLGIAAYPAVRQIELRQGITAQAATGTTTDGWKFSYDETHCEITGCTTDVRGAVTVPASIEIDGKSLPVTQINRGFYYSDRSFITAITIPESVTTIEPTVFWQMKNLQSADIQAKLMKLPSSMFKECTNLETVKLPAGLLEIEESAFQECTRLKAIAIPDTVMTIGLSAFKDCEALEKVTVSGKVTEIQNYTFQGCTGLKSVTIENGVKTIGNAAFYQCSSLTEIVFPKSVTKLNGSPLDESGSLKSVTFENPECQIGSIAGTEAKPVTVYGYDDSTAQKYCAQNGERNYLTFKSIGEKPEPAPVQDNGVFCDANGDGKVDVSDAQLVLKYYVEDFAGNKPSWYALTKNPKAPDAP